jgi:bla regulator protein blaR1
MIPAINHAALALGNSATASLVLKATAIAAMALMGVWLARGSRAAVRHVLLAVTFALLLALPIASTLAPPVRIVVPVAAQNENVTMPSLGSADLRASTRKQAPRLAIPATSRWPNLSLSVMLLALWIMGVMSFLLPVIIGLWQVRSLRRTALPWERGQSLGTQLAVEIGVRRRVEVLLHESVAGPMTCGVFHPAILLSRDTEAWSEEDLGRAIGHELEHVRRADWFTHCLARIACAVYWFHPLVWIAWRRLALEAECACDDGVLTRSEAIAYAEQLVALARRLSTAENSPLLAMASRSDLAARVKAVLDGRQSRGRAGSFAIGVAGTFGALILLTLSPLTITASPQTAGHSATDWEKAAGGQMSFEVASVKQETAAEGKSCDSNIPLGPGDVFPPTGGLLNITKCPIQALIAFAYKLTANDAKGLLSQMPKWAFAAGFAVQARTTANTTKDQMRLMMQSLLADRFKLAIHYETRQAPAYALVLAKPGKMGRQLRAYGNEEPCPTAPAVTPPGAMSQAALATVTGGFPAVCGGLTPIPASQPSLVKVGGRNVSMGLIANTLPSLLLQMGNFDRPVIDQTGLSGTYDFTLEWDRVHSNASLTPVAADAPPPAEMAGPTLSEALRDQLGLKLDPTTVPLSTFVVDQIEEPTPN